MRADLVPAFVLHTRNYTDSRIIAEVFSADQGRFSAVARTGKKNPRFALLRPFQPLLVSCLGRSELRTLAQVESAGPALPLTGRALYCGLYLNELLLRVLAQADEHPALFSAYGHALENLAGGAPMEPVLRNFELDLLAELGYGIAFDAEAETGEAVDADAFYLFYPDLGFVRAPEAQSLNASRTRITGAAIMAVGRREFDKPAVAAVAKNVCRQALQPLLGNKPLKSRELFR